MSSIHLKEQFRTIRPNPVLPPWVVLSQRILRWGSDPTDARWTSDRRIPHLAVTAVVVGELVHRGEPILPVIAAIVGVKREDSVLVGDDLCAMARCPSCNLLAFHAVVILG